MRMATPPFPKNMSCATSPSANACRRISDPGSNHPDRTRRKTHAYDRLTNQSPIAWTCSGFTNPCPKPRIHVPSIGLLVPLSGTTCLIPYGYAPTICWIPSISFACLIRGPATHLRISCPGTFHGYLSRILSPHSGSGYLSRILFPDSGSGYLFRIPFPDTFLDSGSGYLFRVPLTDTFSG